MGGETGVEKNDYDFYLLTRSVLDRLDSDYREKVGLRVDQLADPDQILDYFKNLRAWYRQEEKQFEVLGIYIFLHVNANLWLQGKGCDVLDKRCEHDRT